MIFYNFTVENIYVCMYKKYHKIEREYEYLDVLVFIIVIVLVIVFIIFSSIIIIII